MSEIWRVIIWEDSPQLDVVRHVDTKDNKVYYINGSGRTRYESLHDKSVGFAKSKQGAIEKGIELYDAKIKELQKEIAKLETGKQNLKNL